MGYNEIGIIDEIKSRCNIIDVIGRRVVLKKFGSNHKGLCPFHNEKTPSFVVSEEKQIFTCFGCGATGDVIEFTKRYNNLDFKEAIQLLAEEFGIEHEKLNFNSESKKNRLYEINREAATFFYRNFTRQPNKAEKYMRDRGIESSALRKFGIGFADEKWQGLYDYLQTKEYQDDELLSLGLVSKSNNKIYDKFRDRVIFPIINTRGKIIGFGGRTLGDRGPKYLNSQESSVFQKKYSLYGLNITREDINREDCVILVEGYMDVISLYQHGVRNVSATLGTALTVNQATMLKRYTDNVVLAYDADDAGQAAAIRGMEILYDAGCNVKIMQIPMGKDPDEYIKEKGKEAFIKLVKDALPFMDYKLHLLKQSFDLNTSEGGVQFLKEAAMAIKVLSPVEAEAYIKKISVDTGISEGAFRMEIFGETFKAVPKEGVRLKGKEKKATRISKLEQNLIRLMLLKSSYIPLIEPYKDSFKYESSIRMYEVIRSLYRPDGEIDIKQLKDSLDENDCRILDTIMENVPLANKDVRVFEECIAHIEAAARVKREDELISILSVLDDEKDRDTILNLSKELMEIQKERYRGVKDEL